MSIVMARKRPNAIMERINALPEELRDRVIERAAILWEMGVEGDEADIRAYEMETGRAMRGVARAEPRDAATDAPSKASGD